MMQHKSAQAVLDELGRFAGLGRLPLDGEGRLTLTFDGRIEVTIEHAPEAGCLLLWALLAELGDARSPALMAELLDANFLWHGTGGGTLAVEHGSGKVVLSQALPVMGLEAAALERTLDTFVSAVQSWSRRIEKGGIEDASPAGAVSHHHTFLKA